MSVQGYWADLPSSAFPDLPDDTVAVLPLGATEQHGPHLPLSVDSDLIDAVAAKMLQSLSPEQSVLILPTLTITKSDEHATFPGTLTLVGGNPSGRAARGRRVDRTRRREAAGAFQWPRRKLRAFAGRRP